MKATDRPIGVFDSGIGGLTVVREIVRNLPHESIVYLGDTARLPYGSKSPSTVKAYTSQNLRFLCSKGVKAVVVACNTASATALPDATKTLRVPTLGVIRPGAQEATLRSKNGRIGVLGTRATVGSGAYTRAILRLRPQAHVYSQACPLFVPLAEEGFINGTLAHSVAAMYLEPLLARRVDTIILGCTHYPVLARTIRKVVGPDVQLVDSASAVSRSLELLLKEAGLLRSSGHATFAVYLTDRNPHFRRVGRRFFGRALGPAQHVDL